MIALFDTSAFVKLVIPEPGAAVVHEVWETADHRAASLLLYAEARAAVARAVRHGRLTEFRTMITRVRFDDALARVQLLSATRPLVRLAGDLAEAHALRGYDAVHLATAVTRGPTAVLVTGDRRLAEAAAEEGLGVVVTP